MEEVVAKDDVVPANNDSNCGGGLGNSRGVNQSQAQSLKKIELVQAAKHINIETIKTAAAVFRPSQTVVNTIISYVSVLCQISKRAILNVSPKTFPNCVRALEEAELIKQLTSEAGIYVDSVTEGEKAKLLKIKAKYLAGWDMKPYAFNDRYRSIRTILCFVLAICSYFDDEPETYTKPKMSRSALTKISPKAPEKGSAKSLAGNSHKSEAVSADNNNNVHKATSNTVPKSADHLAVPKQIDHSAVPKTADQPKNVKIKPTKPRVNRTASIGISKTGVTSKAYQTVQQKKGAPGRRNDEIVYGLLKVALRVCILGNRV